MNSNRPDLPAILKNANDIRALKIKLNKIPLRKVHFTQFSYKSPIRLAVVTNMYGAFGIIQRAKENIRHGSSGAKASYVHATPVCRSLMARAE